MLAFASDGVRKMITTNDECGAQARLYVSMLYAAKGPRDAKTY